MTDTDSKLSLSNTSTAVALELYLYLVDISFKRFQVPFKDGDVNISIQTLSITFCQITFELPSLSYFLKTVS